MKTISLGRSKILEDGPCYVIAEIGHNHQGDFKKAMEMIRVAADCGVNAVKFQKRNNKNLFTKTMYNKSYDNENSFGATYGQHREFLEFGLKEYTDLKKYAEENNVEFMCTAFDFESVDFLEQLGITSYKLASGDVTNIPFLKYIAKLKKPIFLSTGAATLEEVRMAYETILHYNDQLCFLHTTCAYPAEYEDLNLRVIQTLKKEFPKAMIGYSGHDNGILASIIAYMLGATVIEKHFTLNRAWKGTDHKFSLEPLGLKKQVRDLQRVDKALGDEVKKISAFEWGIREKMGKSIYTAMTLREGHILTEKDIIFKTPAIGLPPYHVDKILGRKLKVTLTEETPISYDHFEEEVSVGTEKNQSR